MRHNDVVKCGGGWRWDTVVVGGCWTLLWPWLWELVVVGTVVENGSGKMVVSNGCGGNGCGEWRMAIAMATVCGQWL